MDSSTLRALFKVSPAPDRLLNLKRALLLFDELLYMLPDSNPAIRGKLLRNGKVRVPRGKGRYEEEDFDFFHHTTSGFTYVESSIHDPEIREAIAELRDAKIAQEVSLSQFKDLSTEQFRKVRNAIAASASLDDEFNRLSETTADQYQKFKITTVHSVDQHGRKHKDQLISAPFAVLDSYDLTDVLAVAHRANACPIFLDPHHWAEFAYQHKRLAEYPPTIHALYPELVPRGSLRPSLSAVSFTIASSLFDPHTLKARTISELVRYRSHMAEARARFIATDLLELTKLVESAPWSEAAKREIDLYLVGKLKNDLARYRQAMTETWEKLFGSLAVAMSSSARAGGAGGIVGHLLPQASLWELAVAGAVAGLAKELPQIARAVVDSVLEARAHRRSAIAYFAEFD